MNSFRLVEISANLVCVGMPVTNLSNRCRSFDSTMHQQREGRTLLVHGQHYVYKIGKDFELELHLSYQYFSSFDSDWNRQCLPKESPLSMVLLWLHRAPRWALHALHTGRHIIDSSDWTTLSLQHTWLVTYSRTKYGTICLRRSIIVMVRHVAMHPVVPSTLDPIHYCPNWKKCKVLSPTVRLVDCTFDYVKLVEWCVLSIISLKV